MARRYGFGLLAFVLVASVLIGSGTLADENLNGAQVDQWQPSFKQVWTADAACAQRESWDSYWKWVQRFFLGYLFSAGWFHDMAPVTSKVTDGGKRQAIQDELVGLGRTIAGEWAKPNSCRKIDTARLREWGGDVKAATSRDAGDGHEIQSELDSINRNVEALLAGGHP